MIWLSNKRIHYEFSISYLYISREFTICFVNELWLPYLILKFTVSPLSLSGFHFLILEFTLYPLIVNQCESAIFRESNINSLSSSWINYVLTIFLENPQFFTRIHYWIHYVCRELIFTNNFFPEFTINKLSFTSFHCLIHNSIKINNLFCEWGLNQLSPSYIHYGYTSVSQIH